MKTIVRIDRLLLDFFQRISDWLHDWTGLDSILQARICSIGCAVGWLLVITSSLRRGGGFDYLAAILLLIRTESAFWESDGDHQVRREAQMGLRNHRQLLSGWIAERLVFIPFVLLIAVPFDLFLGNLMPIDLAVAFLIPMNEFYSADVQSQRTSRIRELTTKLGRALLPRSTATTQN
jgi:hypothetical protein